MTTKNTPPRTPPADALERQGREFLSELANAGGTAVEYLGRLGMALPEVSAAALINAILRSWDMADESDKLDLIAKSTVSNEARALLKDNTIFCDDEPESAQPADPPSADGPAVPRPGSLEYWPALADAWGLGGMDSDDDAARTRGEYVIRHDGPGTPGPVIATVVPNPAMDAQSRQRLAWLLSMAPRLWQLLRDAVEAMPDRADSGKWVADALMALTTAGDLFPFPSADSRRAADSARSGVNESTIYELSRAGAEVGHG